jgi:hypothetical protein
MIDGATTWYCSTIVLEYSSLYGTPTMVLLRGTVVLDDALAGSRITTGTQKTSNNNARVYYNYCSTLQGRYQVSPGL